MNHADIVRAYYAAWTADDVEGVLRLCTEDIVAVNVPIGPIHGKDKVRAFVARFGNGMTHKRYDVQRLLADDTAVVVEGIENYVKDGKQVSLPYMSTFLFRDGLICEWRDYFDLQTVFRQLGLPLDGSRPPQPRDRQPGAGSGH
jgi:limonene-1,2-epoxide hydrolase